MFFLRIISKAYQELIASRRKDIDFWILIAFLPTFIIARVLVHLAPNLFVNLHGTHIHHLTWGIFILAFSGYLALTLEKERLKTYIAALFGVGLALAFDEFGMWLRLNDDYWVRYSYDAILIISVFLINAVYFSHFWIRLISHLLGLKKN